MKSKRIDISSAKGSNQKTFAVVFQTGDHVMAGRNRCASQEGLSASHFTAIGAFRDVTLGYFDCDKKEYRKIPVHEQVEVLSLVGDITINEGKPNVHAHVVLGRSDGSTCGGHLMEAQVRPTLEVILTESPVHLQRRFDKAAGLPLISLESEPAVAL
jgi:uncharacterized protein